MHKLCASRDRNSSDQTATLSFTTAETYARPRLALVAAECSTPIDPPWTESSMRLPREGQAQHRGVRPPPVDRILRPRGQHAERPAAEEVIAGHVGPEDVPGQDQARRDGPSAGIDLLRRNAGRTNPEAIEIA